eukprot:TRINITY_DN41632_c0_g1_i1.p1 TRINITY_DN41632_c0_g1~~TRINITY_DN41632_c0_g1_i1.p1  ORF type:complete len:931 (+),score=121.67 TRINITY_DN41632_c0_g1_i1:30-2822(+)
MGESAADDKLEVDAGPQSPLDTEVLDSTGLGGTCNSVVKKATETADALSQWTHHCIDELEQNLEKLPELALLLPAKHKEVVTGGLKELEDSGIVVESVSETTYQRRPRVLWILSLQRVAKTQGCSPAAVLAHAVGLMQEKILGFHSATECPFALWPLHDSDVSIAISMCGSILDEEDRWWRKLLWTLRIIQPPAGDDLQTNLTRHYDREVTYCLMWESLFTRSLWPMLLIILPFLIGGYNAPRGAGDCPEDEKIWSSCLRPFLFYLQMGLVFLWALVIAVISDSRESILSFGGGHVTIQECDKTEGGEAQAANVETSSVEADTKIKLAGDSESASTFGKPHESGEPTTLISVCHAGAPADTGQATTKVKGRPLSRARVLDKFKFVSRKLKMQAMQKSITQTLSDIRTKRLNPEYVDSKWRKGPLWKWTWWAITFVTFVVSLCFCFLVLTCFLSLKMFLIYEWGECLLQDCENAEAKHGIAGLLADIGVDLLMAIIFMVLLGELCKAVTTALVNLRNFEKMRDRQVSEDLLSLLIEALGKVGFFMLLAFAFLPSWEDDLDIPEGTIPDVPHICSSQIDYQILHHMFCEEGSSKLCFSGTIFCAAKILPFEKRRSLFENWLNGPFVVGGFVDLLPQIVLPLLIRACARCSRRVYAEDTDQADTARKGSCGILSIFCRCCCCCCSPILRLLACIFMLDGPVIGCCNFICFGQPFGPVKLLEKKTRLRFAMPSLKVHQMGWFAKELHSESADPSNLKEEGDVAADQDAAREREALRQAMYKEFNAVDCLKESKMNFLLVAMFAPVKPIGVIFLLIAQIIRLHTRMPKLFLLSRRCFPRDAHRAHLGHETFVQLVVAFLAFWFVGLAAISYNRELVLWTQDPWPLYLGWLGSGLLGIVMVCLIFKSHEKYRHGDCACRGCFRRRQVSPVEADEGL